MDSCSTEDLEAAGTITMVSPDVCSVSVNMNGIPRTLSFGRRALYSWGIHCEGDMTHLLEEEMEVNVCYKFSESQQSNPYAVAVWVGDKPDLTTTDEPLVTVYNQAGYVDQILDDGCFIIRSDGLRSTAIACKDVMYRDGCLVGRDRLALAIDDVVMFDGTPLESAHASGSGAMYRATCAWTGKEPRLVDRFSLSVASGEQNVDVLTRDRVYGTVIVVPHDCMAFVEVEDAGERVILFRSSFNQNVERVRDVVKVGVRLCMRLCFGYIFERRRQWFAIEAWKSGEEAMRGDKDLNFVYLSKSIRVPESKDGHNPDILNTPSGNELFNAEDRHCENQEKVANFKSNYAKEDLHKTLKSDELFDVNSEVLFSDPPLQGFLRAIGNTRRPKTGIIAYKGIHIFVRERVLYIDGQPCTKENSSLLLESNRYVNFEAIISPKKCKDFSHRATCVWIGAKPSLSVVASSLGKTSAFPPRYENRTLVGKVDRLYLPDVALIRIGNPGGLMFVICLSAFCFGSKPVAGFGEYAVQFINNFVTVKSWLEFKIRKNDRCPVGHCAYDVSETKQKAFNSFSRALNSWRENAKNSSEADVEKKSKPKYFSASSQQANEDSEEISDENSEAEESSYPESSCRPIPFNTNAEVLYRDPPLCGTITNPSKTKPLKNIGKIAYGLYNVHANRSILYINGRLCTGRQQFIQLVDYSTRVYFEAVPRPMKFAQAVITHRATCVWVGDKPTWPLIASSLKNKGALKKLTGRVCVGQVRGFYFPDVALVVVGTKKKSRVTVCLHSSVLCCESGLSQHANSRDYIITNFVKLSSYISFKIKKIDGCPLGQCAYDINMSTNEARKAFLA